MLTPLVVPDASVVLKWVLPSDDEPDAEKALLLRAAILDEAADLAIDLSDYGILERAFAEFDLAHIHRVTSALDHVVDLAATGLLRGGLPVGIVEDDVVGADAQFGPDGRPVFQDQVLELQTEDAVRRVSGRYLPAPSAFLPQSRSIFGRTAFSGRDR